MLAVMTRMTLTQVSTWFANARRRLKKEYTVRWLDDDDNDDNDDNDCGSDDDSSDQQCPAANQLTTSQHQPVDREPRLALAGDWPDNATDSLMILRVRIASMLTARA